MSTTPEGKVKKEIKAYLDSLGAYYFMPVNTGYGAASVDILACVRGRFVGIEVKAPGKKATRRQFQVLQKIYAAGGIAFTADSVGAVKVYVV